MNILFVGRKFGGVAGGVERTAITLMDQMCGYGHTVSLLTWDRADAVPHYPLNSTVQWARLNMGDPGQRASWSLRGARQLRIRRLVREMAPDVIIGYQQGAFLAMRIATIGQGIPVIAAERNAPQRFNYLRKGKYRSLIFLSLGLAAKITIQFPEYKSAYPRYLQSRLEVIPNPIAPAAPATAGRAARSDRKVLLFVGHLAYQKNPQVLVEAFASVAARFPDWELQMVGAGEYQAALLARIVELNLSDQILLRGTFADMATIYRQADAFCLPSWWEGFPNALGEALAHGLPAVGFAECAGVNILIRHGENGLLASGNGDPLALAQCLAELMSSPARREQMARAAAVSVQEYLPDPIFARWDELFRRVGQRSRR